MYHKYVDFARSFCNQVDFHRNKHVSIIFRKGQIISVGTNGTKTHPLAKKHGYLFDARHSELDALIRVPDNQRTKMKLVNFRFNTRKQLKLSYPCPKCLPWVNELFDEVWYSTNEGIFEKCTNL